MSTLKNKLAASVRQAKAQTSAKPAAAPKARPAVKPAASQTAAARKSSAPVAAIRGGEPPASGAALFPARVWPD